MSINNNTNNDLVFIVIGVIFFSLIAVGFIAIEASFSTMYDPSVTEWNNGTYDGLLFDTTDGSRMQTAYTGFATMLPGLMWLIILIVVCGIIYKVYNITKGKRGKNPIYDKKKRLKFKKFKDI